jgi:hypothetical protein
MMPSIIAHSGERANDPFSCCKNPHLLLLFTVLIQWFQNSSFFHCENQHLLLSTVVVSLVLKPQRQLQWLSLAIYPRDASKGRVVGVPGGSGHDNGEGKSDSSFFCCRSPLLLLLFSVVSIVLMP